MSEPTTPDPLLDEPHPTAGLASRLNWLRAGVLGANDGIVSTAGLVMGVAGASVERGPVVLAGIAGLVAGALSMGGGEFVSVSTQRDTEQAVLNWERHELATMPDEELRELTALYEAKGLSPQVAAQVARELTAHDALAAHAEVELGIDPQQITNPWHAAWASMLAFTLGALLPLLAIVLPPLGARIPVTVTCVIIALVATGWISARLGKAAVIPAIRRNVLVGVLAMGLTFAVGSLVGGLG